MNRRKFIALVGGAAVWPLAAAGADAASPRLRPLSNEHRGPAAGAAVLGLRSNPDITFGKSPSKRAQGQFQPLLE
jgi:hypothetical protein